CCPSSISAVLPLISSPGRRIAGYPVAHKARSETDGHDLAQAVAVADSQRYRCHSGFVADKGHVTIYTALERGTHAMNCPHRTEAGSADSVKSLRFPRGSDLNSCF